MKARPRFGSSLALAAVAFVAFASAAAAQTTAPAQPAKPHAPKKPAAAPQADWPRKIQLGEMTVLLDAPLAESLEGTNLKARGTAQVRRAEETESASATLWYEADVRIDREHRLVTLVSVSVARVELPGALPAREQRLATRIGAAVTRQQWTLPLDDVLASAKFAARRNEPTPKLGTDPPKILFETEPAVLVVFDGARRFDAVEGVLSRARAQHAVSRPARSGGERVLPRRRHRVVPCAGTAGPWAKAGVVPPEALRIARADRKDAGVAEAESRRRRPPPTRASRRSSRRRSRPS